MLIRLKEVRLDDFHVALHIASVNVFIFIGVYVDKNGSIFSTSYSNGFGLSPTRVWHPNGTYQGTYAMSSGAYTSKLDGDTTGALYITDQGSTGVLKARCPTSPSGSFCRGSYITPSGINRQFGVRVFNEVLYVTDYSNHRIATRSLTTNVSSTFAGTYGSCGNSANVPATSGQICYPYTIWINTAGDLQ